MVEICKLREALDRAEASFAVAAARVRTAQLEVTRFPTDVHRVSELARLANEAAQAESVRDAARAAFDEAGDPLGALAGDLPLVLLPVRIETAYLPGADGGLDLVVRVYPDDIHVNSHEPELTHAEQSAGADYWRAIWGAGSNQERLDSAWTALTNRVKPARAAWIVKTLEPSMFRPTEETPIGTPQPEPPLPSVSTRPDGFSRPAATELLPDRWHVVGKRGGDIIFEVEGSAIQNRLDVSFGPPGTGGAADGVPFSGASAWLVDLDAAIASGMAVRIPMAGPDFTVEQLFVFGFCEGLSEGAAAKRLEAMLDAHQFTKGLGFLPAGSPTNNTSVSRSAWEPHPDPSSPQRAEQARSAYDPGSNQNAALAAFGLGIDGREALCGAPHGLDDQQSSVAILQQQLWFALGAQALRFLFTTWDLRPGSNFDGSWNLHADPSLVTALEDHCGRWVRSRGLYPTLRIGPQPYGLLPVSCLSDWTVASDHPTAKLVEWLRELFPYFLAAVQNVPHVRATEDPNPDETVVNVLARQPVSPRIVLRALGVASNAATSSKPLPLAPIPQLPSNSFTFLSVPADVTQPFPIPVVHDAHAYAPYLRALRDFLTDCLAVLEKTMTAQDWADKYRAVLEGTAQLAPAPPADLFMGLFANSLDNPAVASDRLDSRIGTALFFGAVSVFQSGETDELRAILPELLPLARTYIARIAAVCELPAEDFEPLTREILDVFSHRFDAWVTSIVARRLEEFRGEHLNGVALGGFGWIEDLAPRTDLTPTSPAPPGFDEAFTSPRQHYIHAPSMQHATTAAVLRAGFDSHAHADALAVNLESRRVRLADWLITGVRNGQTLRALLGYRLERGLHDAGLDALIEGLRKDHPLPLADGPEADINRAGAREAIAARNVVDGLEVFEKRAAVRAQFAGQPKVSEVLDDLENAVDAVGDLLLAESVHHLVGGNPLRAGLAADTISRGESLPDRFEVVRTPRSGRPLQWQLGVLLPASFRSQAAGWRGDGPRAQVVPHAEAWAAETLGDAVRWRIRCTVTEPGGESSDVFVSLDDLGMAALDVVAEAGGESSVLERRILDHVSALHPSAAVTLNRSPQRPGELGVAELTGLAERLRSLLGAAVVLGPQQVEGADASSVAGVDTAEFHARAAAFQASFDSAADALTTALDALRAAVEATPEALAHSIATLRSAMAGMADHGMAAAYPDAAAEASPDRARTLIAHAATVAAAAAPLTAMPVPAPPAADATASQTAAWLDSATNQIQSILGKSIPVSPVYQLPANSVFASSFAESARPRGADSSSVMGWLRRAGQIRRNTATFFDVLSFAEAFDQRSPSLAVAQLPPVDGEPWAGLAFEGASPKTRVSTVVAAPTAIDPAQPFAGLIFDSWTELIPGLTSVADRAKGYEQAEVTGVAFTVDAPDAYPPQSILMAVAPDPSRLWSFDVLYKILEETLNLAKIRGVDLGDLPRLGRVLPGIYSGHDLTESLAKAGAHS